MRKLLLLSLLLSGCTTYDQSIYMKDVNINTTIEKKCSIKCTTIRNPENPYK